MLDDRYRIETRLGQGGMGVVYAARHTVIDKRVAIKILRHEYCRDGSLVERFIREAKAASRIGHPNIVDVTDFGRLSDGHIYFVMEYLDGVTLSKEIRRLKVIPVERMLALALQICQGLFIAHNKGIVHRDLKPENIFIVHPATDLDGEQLEGYPVDVIKLLDFGIAKMSWGRGTRLTKAGSIFGTPQYMSPEQAAGRDADHRGDVYSLGCILYEMLTGEVPFIADTFVGTLTKHMFEKPLPPRQLRPELGIPKEIEAVILRAMSKRPEDRFDDMGQMSQALNGSLLGVAPLDATYPPGSTQIYPGAVATDEVSADTGSSEAAENLVVTPQPILSSVGSAALELDVPPPAARHRSGRRDLGLLLAMGAVAVLLLLAAILVLTRQPADRQIVVTGSDLSITERSPAVASPLLDAAPAPQADASPAELEIAFAVRSQPTAAQVTIDGKPHGVTPLRLQTSTGKVLKIRVDKRGYLPRHVTVHVARNQADLALRLKRRKHGAGIHPDLREPADKNWRRKGQP
ncbi:MAG: serine/threonine protein kinase [Deltaproteobacteria bacterium]|nr:serine/threonine protein kinase [Deltaproteobacteria bacterium]